jgi:hypothetical protein
MKAKDIDGNLLCVGCNIEIAEIDIAEIDNMGSAYNPPFGVGDRFTIVAMFTKSQMDRMFRYANIQVRPDIWCQIDNDWFCRCGAVRLIPEDKKSDSKITFETKKEVAS